MHHVELELLLFPRGQIACRGRESREGDRLGVAELGVHRRGSIGGDDERVGVLADDVGRVLLLGLGLRVVLLMLYHRRG